jgi:hypothetical protein
MRIKFYQRIFILSVLVLLWSALVPGVASSQQDSIVKSVTKLFNKEKESAKDNFGHAVAVDGSTLVVGAYRDGPNDSGSVYLTGYTDAQNGNDAPSTKLIQNDDAESRDRFGNSVDISGDALVVGAYYDSINGTHSGSAYVMRVANDYTSLTLSSSGEQSILTPSDPVAGSQFGYSIAVSGNTVVVGADRGEAVYVFDYNGSSWVEKAKLVASDAQGVERFGTSVAVDGDTIVVGAIYGRKGDLQTGSVYVFSYNGSDWVEETELFADDLKADDQFGYSVAIDDDTILVGARLHDEGEEDSGAAYMFRRNAGTWIEEAKLIGSGLSAGARFGHSVGLSGNTAVVGAYKNDLNLLVDTGSAYLFRFDGAEWQPKDMLPFEVTGGEEFGCAVAISGDIVVVGAHEDDDLDGDGETMLDAGSVYVFTLNQPPVAEAGADREVEEGSQITLDGSQSYDPDYDTLEYLWTQPGGPPVELGTTNEETLTFTAPSWSAENEKLTFRLEVKDESEATSFDDIEITVLQSATNVTEINSVLDWQRRPWRIDKDMYTFYGSRGDKVLVTLRAKTGGKNNNGDRATLKLKDNIRGVSFYRVDSSRLPNKICTTLPATGQYHILVAGQRRLLRGKGFSGEYTLTLEGASGSLEKGAGTPVEYNKHGRSAKSHKQHPVWDWISSWFRH